MICEGWEGSTVDGKYPLLEWLGGWADRCIFLTVGQGTHKANIKLIPASGAEADAHLAYWETARSLSHPYLLQLMESGRCNVHGFDVVYILTEKTDTFLSTFIPAKPMAPSEIKRMLDPIADALMYLHEKGFGHGSVRPSNIVLVGNQWKLTSEKITSGETAGRKPDEYDAPEVATGELTPAADVWSLGMIVVEAFDGRTPAWDPAVNDDPTVPDSIPEPFLEIARGCLRRDPLQRISISEVINLLARYDPPAAPEEAKIEPVSAAIKPTAEPRRDEKKAASAVVPVAEEKREAGRFAAEAKDSFADDQPVPFAPRSRMFTDVEDEGEGGGRKGSIFVAVLVLFAVVGFLAWRGYLGKWFSPSESQNAPASSQTSQEAQASQSQAAPSPTPPVNSSPGPPPSQPQSGAPESSTSGRPLAAAPATAQPKEPALPAEDERTPATKAQPRAAKPEEKASPSQPADRRGEVLKRVMPNVEPGASAIMPRAVEVEIRVSVDESGTVSSTEYMTKGEGNYFARKAHQAAQAWKFKAPVIDGQPAASEWLLVFRFERHNIDVTATEVR